MTGHRGRAPASAERDAPSAAAPRRGVVWLARLLPTAVVASVFALLLVLKPAWFFAEERGKAVNIRAWEAGFVEHGLSVPARGPREGYWGARLGSRQQAGERWLHTAGDEGDLFTIDAAGRQTLPCPDGASCPHWLVTGGSLGWGAYASTQAATWFGLLGRQLATRGAPHRITVVAAGGWKAFQEVFGGQRALDEHDDVEVWLMMTGLNDLTNGPVAASDEQQRGRAPGGELLPKGWHANDWDDRRAAFAVEADKARVASASAGARLVLVLQPALMLKRTKTPMELEVLAMSAPRFGGEVALADAYAQLITETVVLRSKGVTVVDCSRAFDDDPRTVFADLWHFGDVGHRLLSDCVADGVLLRGLPTRPVADPDAGTD